MKGIAADQVGAEYHLVDDLEKPTPGPTDLLVKPIYGATNPVDELIRNSGMLVDGWPFVPCCDISGTVVEVGSEVTGWKAGDAVFGIQGVAAKGFGGAAEFCLFPSFLAFKRPENITLPEGATVGVGLLTAAAGLYSGLNVPLLDSENLPAASDEWILVLGGGGSVGGFTVQLAKLGGYKVITTASARSSAAATAFGADEIIDYKSPVEEQVAKIKEITKGGLHRIYDTTSHGITFVKAVLEAIKDEPGQKYFASVNDWDDFGELPGGAKKYATALGPVGRPSAVELNAEMSKYVKALQSLFDSGKLKPLDYTIVGETGLESFIEGIKVQNSGGKVKKIVVKLQDE